MSAPWDHHDPLLRWLRAISIIAFLALVVVVVLDTDRADNLPLVALLAGASLLQLGYEVFIPGLSKTRGEGEREDDDDERG